MKYAWMDVNSKTYALTEMCVVLDVSISGYRAWKRGGTPDRKRLTDVQTLAVIRAQHKRRYKVTTDSKHSLPVAENLLDRNFTPAAPNQVWTSDMTYLWTNEGWL